jgi:HlyD family secretion protein
VKTKWKITIGIVLAVVAAGGTVASVRWSQSAQVTVQSAIAARSDLASIVTASGEIKPKTTPT